MFYILPHSLLSLTNVSGIDTHKDALTTIIPTTTVRLPTHVGRDQCDQMVRLMYNYLVTYNMENSPNSLKTFAKVGSKFCQIQNKPPNVCQSLNMFRQSGEILPNLVTLGRFTTCLLFHLFFENVFSIFSPHSFK